MAIKVTKEIVKNILKDVDKKVKAADDGAELIPRSTLEKKQPKDKVLKIKNKKLIAKDGEQTATQVKIKKENIKLKDQSKAADEVVEDLKIDLLDNKIGREILSDFNINKITSEEDIKVLIDKISKKFAK